MPIIIAIIAVIALVGVGGFFLQSQTPSTSPAPVETAARPEDTATPSEVPTVTEVVPTNESPETSPTAEPVANTQTLTARGEYLTPARTSHTIDVTLTLSNGVVSDASIVYDGGAGFSNPHQERFDGAYKAQVVGKRLDQINLSRVGGASVTSRSFNEVIDQLESQISA